MEQLNEIRNPIVKYWALSLSILLSMVTLLAGAAEEDNQPRRPWKIAILRTDAPFAVEIEQGFRESMAKLGYVEGQNVHYLPTLVVKPRIEDFAETAKLVKSQLKDASPDVFAAISTQASIPAWKVLNGTSIPLVFSGVTFPVEAGLIAAYGQPTGQNVTGVGYSISPRQRLELLRQLFPDRQRFKKIAFAYSGQVLQDAIYVKYLRSAGSIADWQIFYINYFDYAQNNASLRLLVEKLQQLDPDLVFGWYGLDTLGNDTSAFKELLDKLRKPLIAVTVKGLSEGAIGGVITDHRWLGEQQAKMIDQIFHGGKIGEIPPVEPTTYLIGLNLLKARELGISFEQSLINSAHYILQ